jgi:ectoine hydroxylase-related dioxygenase (phytanoyl-CoA dioxygenase family)
MEEKSFLGNLKESLDLYNEQGYFIERGVLTEEECDDIITYAREQSIKKSTEPQIPLLIHYAQHPTIVKIAQQLLGGEAEALRVEYCFEEPGNKAIAAHQDGYGMEVEPGDFITVTMALEDADRTSGAAVIWKGSHREGPLAHMKDTGGKTIEQMMDECEEVEKVHQKGDVIFYNGYIINKKEKNTSGKFAPVLLVSYIRKGAKYKSGPYFAPTKDPITLLQEAYSPAS